MTNDKTVTGWYFSWPDHRIGYRSRRKAALGVTHHYRGKPEVGGGGLLAGITVRAALDISPQPIAWRVELSGHIDARGESIAAQQRRYIGGGIDVSPEVCRWARMCVLALAYRRKNPLRRPIEKWLKGDGRESLRAAALQCLEARTRSEVEEMAYHTAIVPSMCGMNLVRRNLYIASECVRLGGVSWAAASGHLGVMVSTLPMDLVS